METITIQPEVVLTATRGHQLPGQNRLIDQFTDHVYEFF
jgi:hypothetical protein